MKKLLLGMTLLASMSSFATVYDCQIDKNQLGPGFTDDLKFKVIVSDESASITMFDEPISDDCDYQKNKVTCKDEEGMPYLAVIKDETTVSLSVGYILPETDANCTSTIDK